MSCFLLSMFKGRGRTPEHQSSSPKEHNTGKIFAKTCLWILLEHHFYWGKRGGGYRVTAQKPLWSL